MTNQQGAPEALRLAAIANSDGHITNIERNQIARELRHLHAENERLAAMVEAQQPAPSAAAAGNALPEGWVPLVITHEGQYPEEVAYGPQILMDRLGKWLRKYFDHVVASKAQPSPAPQADSQPAPEYVGNGMFKGETIEKAAEHWANWCDVRCMTGLSEFLRVVATRAPADSVTAPAGEVVEQWRPMETAPKDGTLVRLLVEFEDNATEDGEGPQPTIGSNTADNTGEDIGWRFAGWNWTHDCYTQGVGKPVGWLPMVAPAPPAQAQAGAVPQYRLLQPGVDRIEDDDEFLSDDTTTWAIDPDGIFSGNIYGGHVLRPARRRIKGGQHGTE